MIKEGGTGSSGKRRQVKEQNLNSWKLYLAQAGALVECEGWGNSFDFTVGFFTCRVRCSLLHAWVPFSCFSYALATGNWGGRAGSAGVRTGVSQVLNRLAYASTLSHLRRINTPIDRSGSRVSYASNLHWIPEQKHRRLCSIRKLSLTPCAPVCATKHLILCHMH